MCGEWKPSNRRGEGSGEKKWTLAYDCSFSREAGSPHPASAGPRGDRGGATRRVTAAGALERAGSGMVLAGWGCRLRGFAGAPPGRPTCRAQGCGCAGASRPPERASLHGGPTTRCPTHRGSSSAGRWAFGREWWAGRCRWPRGSWSRAARARAAGWVWVARRCQAPAAPPPPTGARVPPPHPSKPGRQALPADGH